VKSGVLRPSAGLPGALFALALAAAPARAGGDPSREVRDPWEGMNRGIFAFNERLDWYFLEPLATGWDAVVPDPVESALARFFTNLRFPIVFGNDVLQAKPLEAATDVARFLVNSTVGVAGLFDPATRLGLEENDEDLGQTLGVLGVPEGPYFVIPFLGPSTVRDAFGLAGDSFSTVYPWFGPFWVGFAVTGTDILNDRSIALEAIAEERAQAFDFYAFVRSAYLQNRRARVSDEIADDVPPEASDDDLYYFEDEEE
jgi:phospholipid-binding lipoprotein MlaA